MDSGKNLTEIKLRLRSFDQNNPMAEVITYLKSLSRDDMEIRINAALIMVFLPYARFHSGKYTFEQLRFACWEAQDSLDKHGSTMRLALGVVHALRADEKPNFLQHLPLQSSNSFTTDNSVSEANLIRQEDENISVESNTNESNTNESNTNHSNDNFSYEDLNSAFGD